MIPIISLHSSLSPSLFFPLNISSITLYSPHLSLPLPLSTFLLFPFLSLFLKTPKQIYLSAHQQQNISHAPWSSNALISLYDKVEVPPSLRTEPIILELQAELELAEFPWSGTHGIEGEVKAKSRAKWRAKSRVKSRAKSRRSQSHHR